MKTNSGYWCSLLCALCEKLCVLCGNGLKNKQKTQRSETQRKIPQRNAYGRIKLRQYLFQVSTISRVIWFSLEMGAELPSDRLTSARTLQREEVGVFLDSRHPAK